MNRSDLTEEERDELTVLQLQKLLQQFGNPLKRPAEVIPWPKPANKEASAEATALPNKPFARIIRLPLELR
jgi:hypothetical protein